MQVIIQEVEENIAALGLDRDNINNIATIPQWELDGWTAIHDSCTRVLQMAEMFSQSYLQLTTIQEARTSNETANGVARITMLTTLFIPLSTVAAVLSMNQAFLPGNQDGWISGLSLFQLSC